MVDLTIPEAAYVASQRLGYARVPPRTPMIYMTRRMASAVGLLTVGSYLTVGAQEPQRDAPARQAAPVLRASVEQVVVDAVVTDADGAPVFGLTAADFEVVERDRPQTIASFTEVDLPRDRAADPSTAIRASDARSNRLAGTGGVFLLLLDDLHVSVDRTAIVRREARAFVRQYVQPGDVVAVLRTSGGRGQDFTEDMALVDNAITAFSGRAEPTATMQRLQGRLPARPDPYDGQRAMPGRPETTLGQTRLATDALQTIVNAAALLETVPGRRKAMLYFSEGVAIPLETKEGQEIVSMLDRAWTASARANLTIYPIDPRRLTQGAQDLVSLSGLVPADRRIALEAERRVSVDFLRAIADGTGGVAAVDTNNLARTLSRVASDSRHYYLLGYVPHDTRRDGRYRELSVRVRRPGLQVSARKGYTAPSDTAPRSTARLAIADPKLTPDLRMLLERPLPEGSLTFAAAPVVLPGVDRNLRIVIEVAAEALPADARDKTLELALVALDGAGRIQPIRIGRASIASSDAAAIAKGGLRIVEQMTLPAGRFQLRIALREQQGGRSGVVMCDVDVPDPQAPGLAMSNVILGAASAARVPSLNVDDRLAAGLGGQRPTTARIFEPGDVVHAFVELTAGRAAGASIAVTATLHDAKGKAVLTRDVPAVAQPNGPARHTLELTIDDEPGQYVLRFEARAGSGQPIATEVRFEIGSPSR
jgi:VWFA-related protein